MMSFQFLRSQLLCLLVSVSCLLIIACLGDNADIAAQLNDDVLGLIVFKSDLNDPSGHLSSWNEDDLSACSWRFVQCNPATRRVSGVSLDALGLSGKIGRGLEKLQYLKVLSLSHNNITGSISPLLSLSNTLQSLNLSHNSLSGSIPSSFVNMASMKSLDLSENSFSGQVPESLFENCFSLHHLSLARNTFEGSIPSTILRCSLLNSLDLSKNRFGGSVDFNGIWSLTRLRTLDLSNNALSGNLPPGISAIHNLKEMKLQSNHFSGPLPSDVGFCLHLNRLDFSDNLFNEALPESLGRLQFLSFFKASNNLLTNEIPQWIGNMASLEYLDLSGNQLSGNIPDSIGDLTSLSYLGLSNNKLEGNIPSSLVSCTKLSSIHLRGNGFNGNIPEGLFGLESLEEIDLSHNFLKGEIPEEMIHASKLKYLNLSWNDFHSQMPPELGMLQNLTVLDLQSNSLYGSIPEDLCDSGNLAILQLDGNSLNGAIPDEIGNCSSLFLLSLCHNNLSGSIPKSMSKLKELKVLKLEFNELSGEIPQELGMLQNLLSLNISYNRLTGRLPSGSIFQNLDKSSLEGNFGLCSPLLKGPCKMNVPKPLVLDPNAYNNQMGTPRNESSPSTPSIMHRHRFLSVSVIVAISAVFVIILGVIAISLLNVSVRRRLAFVDNALESMCSSSSRLGSPPTGKLILFDSGRSSLDSISNPENLLNKASEIGDGVFGTVYKVPLGSQGRMVAIKRLVTSNIVHDPEDFDREVRILGKARHPNLIALEGYYWTPQLKLLVTEYAPNGSLQSKLHDRLPSSPPLSWPNRFKILLGTAKGLAHLHHSFRPPIIHYDLKPSNILLDENFNAKISDFGLARLLTKLDRHVMSNRFQSALGYVAPELACQSLRVNEKCDIYGFGVMILELVTGRRPVEYGEDNVVILKDHVRVMIEQGIVLECVDPNMSEYPEDEVLPVLKLALVCTSQIPSSRPSMAEVVQILQVIKTPVPHRMEMF